jgi:RNA polymerase sigma factor (sigma-70 family)
MPKPEDELIAKPEALVVEGPGTFDEFFEHKADSYLPRALGLAFYVLGRSDEAEDVTQEAMARAWRARRSLRNPDVFEAWMDRILVNACREHQRRRGRLREVDLASEPDLDSRFAVADRSDAFLARDSIYRAMADLTVEQRAAVALRYWRDLSLEEIAVRLDWPLGTVKSRLHHALAAIKVRLEQDEIEVVR